MSKARLEPIDYSASDAHLADALIVRNLYVPKDEKNKLVRKHAIRLLQEWEANPANQKRGRMARVVFIRSTNPSAGKMVFGSLNSYQMYAPYDKEVVVSENFLRECIDRAVTVYREPKEINGVWDYEESFSQVYPYRVLEWIDPTDDEESETVTL